MMTENFLLKLLVYQGRDWKPSDDAKVSIRANLGKNVAGTSPTDCTTSCPKFNAELCWEVDRKTLRQFKLNRIPIKVKFVTGNPDCQNVLGYVILPLSLAAENIEVHAQWYKLLGGKLSSNKDAPHILMALSLTDADLEEKEQSSDEEPWHEESNSNDGSEDEAELAQTNGYSSAHQENGQSVNQNGRDYDMDDSCEIDEEDVAEEENYSNDSDDEENLYEGAFDVVDKEDISDKEQNYHDESICSVSNSEYDEDELANPQPELSREGNNSNVQINKEKEARVLPTDIKSKEEKGASETCNLLDSRAQLRGQLKRLSKEHSLSRLEISSHRQDVRDPNSTTDVLNISNLSPIVGKRLLDPAELVNSTAKVRKIDTPINNGDISWNGNILDQRATSSSYTGNDHFEKIFNSANRIHSNTARSILKTDPILSIKRKSKNASSIMDIILSTSGVDPNDSILAHDPEDEERCRAELSEDNGYFRILPTDSGKQEKYSFSVIVVYAKDLDQVISDSLWSKLKQDGLQFKYTLFGCTVFTEAFFTIDGHILLSERGTATVRSSKSQLCKYFGENSLLSVDLISGNMVIASCIVDMEKLQGIDYRQQVVIEGAYKLSVGPAFLKHADTSVATVGVCVEMCQENSGNKRDKIYVTKKASKAGVSKYENYRHPTQPIDDSSYTSSESEDEDELLTRLVTRMKSGSNRSKIRKVMHGMKREKRDYLEKAALEIEKWKEDQKQTFLRNWSSREETLQKHLASEWNSKVKVFEGILEQRLAGCSKLQDTLSEALSKLSIQESKLRDKETKVNKLEKELRIELSNIRNNHGDVIGKSVIAENKKIEFLENEVKKFKELTKCHEKTNKDQMQEIFSLRKKILELDDTRIIKRENERLSEQLSLTEEKKQYYKHSWTSAMEELRVAQAAKKHKHHLSTDDEHHSHEYSNLGLKVRHLIEERKALTESGLYSHSHSMVRQIDKKIKSLINSANK